MRARAASGGKQLDLLGVPNPAPAVPGKVRHELVNALAELMLQFAIGGVDEGEVDDEPEDHR